MTTRKELFTQALEILGLDEMAAMQIFWARALVDVFPDEPKRVDAIYLFGQMPENEGTVLSQGADLFDSRIADYLCVPEQFGRGFPPRAEPWALQLNQWVVPMEVIVPIEYRGEAVPSTLTEAVELMRVCRERGWTKIGVLAAAFHQPRAFLTAFSEAAKDPDAPKVFSLPPDPESWTQEVTHSSGRSRGTRQDLIMEEILRMARYQNLLRPSKALAYLDARDK